MKLRLSFFGIILLLAISLLTACGADDPPVPEVRSSLQWSISQFDTVQITFNVEIEKPTSKNVSITPSGALWSFGADKKSIQVWGAATWPENNEDSTFTSFKPHTDYLVTLSGILSTEGRILKQDQEIEIEVLPSIDSDFDDGVENNGNWGTADLIYTNGKFVPNGKLWGAAETFSGILAGDYISKTSDLRDWYGLDLTRSEKEIKIRLLSPRASELALHFYGPVPANKDRDNIERWDVDKAESPKANQEQSLDLVISSDRHLVGIPDDKPVSTPVRYYILVTYQSVSVVSPSIPYRLEISGKEE